MEEALRAALHHTAPTALEHIRVAKHSDGSLTLDGFVDIRLATQLNIGLLRFLRTRGREFGLSGVVSRQRLELRVPKVRLGDVTNEYEREVLAEHADAELYSNPENMIDMPEWNSDFVTASDRRHRAHIRPRYASIDTGSIKAVADLVADCCKAGGPLVVHTGAGISAAAGVATYREGSSKSVSISAALPTYAHYALVALAKSGAVDYVCSQNVDGLHRRSGLAASQLSELHGNSYIETCSCCTPPMEFVRPFDVYSTEEVEPRYWARYVRDRTGQHIEANVPLTENERASGIHHITGRACPCGGGPLRDSIIHFGESLPTKALEEAERRSRAAKVNLVLGCSMLVRPAASLPFKGSGIPILVALTCTGSDAKALRAGGLLLRAPADAVMEAIVQSLGLFSFANSPQFMSMLHDRVRLRDKAVLQHAANIPYTGGDDGGVVPDHMLQPATASSAERALQKDLCLRQLHQQDKDEGWHRWSLQLEAKDGDVMNLEDVEEVRFGLHPTFEPSMYSLTKPPFKIGPFVGWGTFDVDVQVKLATRPPISTRFPLSFRKPDTVMMLAPAA
mmetsp:Transcript_17593/g.31771  ORF Transcript_17593/g.31771 Transcript_17593/m.31771 type:complete len:565 (-) Transcript_17593:139-1833(-)